ncbi:MAG: porin [Cryomorphaceae bacterium]|nr:porin [Flavobacteriales bacterium]
MAIFLRSTSFLRKEMGARIAALALAWLCVAPTAFAQSDLSIPLQVKFGGYLDVFYAFDFDHPGTDARQPFLFNHNRHNEFNLNLGYIKAEVLHHRYRANLTLQTGTYAADNYAEEPAELRNIFEAYAGLRLSANQDLWLDVGVFESHIGFEYAESIKNPTLTRSLVAEHSPYFLAGARLHWQPSDRWEFLAVAANGWQRIQRVEGNSLLSFGTMVHYTHSENLKLNWSTLIGTDDPDTSRRMRYYNSVYADIAFGEKWSLIAGFDIGAEQKAKGSERYSAFYTPTLIVRHAFDRKWAVAVRGEYYNDPDGVIIATGTENGFDNAGFSLNVDYQPLQGVICRVEGRMFNSRDAIFQTADEALNYNAFIVASIAVAFGN